MEGTFLPPSSRVRGQRASASSALLQELERTAANASAGGRGSLGISRELSKLVNKKTPTMSKEQVMRKMRRGGGDDADEEECVEGLTLYETYREPIAPYEDPNHTTTLQVRLLNVELTCPICLGIMRQTMTVMECLHRFCDECISKCLRWGKKECPTCRVHCSSRRHLRPDPNFDALIATVYPNLDEYEAQEQEFIADINKKLNRKSLTESVEKGLMRQMAASRGPRAKRDKEQLEAMESPANSSSSAPASSSSSSSSSSARKRKSSPPAPSSSSSSSTTRGDNHKKRSKHQIDPRPSGEAEPEEPTSMELDASGIPLAHYHIPHRRPQPPVSSSSSSSSSSSPAVASFLSQADTLISFLLLPHPDDERLSTPASSNSAAGEVASTTTMTTSSSSSDPSAAANNLTLQRPFLRTSRRVTVEQIGAFLASKFPRLLARDYTPSTLDFVVPPSSSSSSSGDQPSTSALFVVSIVPTKAGPSVALEGTEARPLLEGEEQKKKQKEEQGEAKASDPTMMETDGATSPSVAAGRQKHHVELSRELTVDAIATQFWDGQGDLTLFYRLNTAHPAVSSLSP